MMEIIFKDMVQVTYLRDLPLIHKGHPRTGLWSVKQKVNVIDTFILLFVGNNEAALSVFFFN